jgi:hypothetical protein
LPTNDPEGRRGKLLPAAITPFKILGLYRGASSPLAATMLYSSLLFFSYGKKNLNAASHSSGQYRHLAENYWPAWLPKGELTNGMSQVIHDLG